MPNAEDILLAITDANAEIRAIVDGLHAYDRRRLVETIADELYAEPMDCKFCDAKDDEIESLGKINSTLDGRIDDLAEELRDTERALDDANEKIDRLTRAPQARSCGG